MGLLDKTRALGYSRSAELMADVRMLQGKCRKAVARWGGHPETGGGFGAGAGRIVVKAMDTLAANMESMLARSREEVMRLFSSCLAGFRLLALCAACAIDYAARNGGVGGVDTNGHESTEAPPLVEPLQGNLACYLSRCVLTRGPLQINPG